MRGHLIAHRTPLSPRTNSWCGVPIKPSQLVHDSGVALVSELSLVAHVSHITSVCYFHIRRQLHLLRRSLSLEAARALFRALVHSSLDYCNAVLADAPQSLVLPWYRRFATFYISALEILLLLFTYLLTSSVCSVIGCWCCVREKTAPLNENAQYITQSNDTYAA